MEKTMRYIVSYVFTFFLLMAFATPTMAWVQYRGDAESGKVSGVRNSDRVVTIGPVDAQDEFALQEVSWGERSDEPCWFEVRTTDLTSTTSSTDTPNNAVSRCGQFGPTERSKRSVMYGGGRYDYTAATTQPVYITGLRVCMNKRRTRIKGIQIEGKQPNPDYESLTILTELDEIDGVINRPRKWQANCSDHWGRWSRCGRNQVAVALDIHFEGGLQPRSATGIAVQCRTLSREGTLVRPTD